ncbi:MAG TPA: DUF2889 domain-containing protein [Ramlibacter sp.]|jgi:hypothetical protein|nr:DUF2889 domain-containing protein [Ramlibacter sp.]
MLAEDPSRIPIHLRDIAYRSFLRADGLWDVEGTLLDTKGYDQVAVERGPLPAGTAIHHMRIRLTIDDTFTVHGVEVEMPTTPFGECQGGKPPLQALVGCRIGGGWRKAVQERMGGESGCTHLRELLFGMGTAAFQTVGRYRAHQRKLRGEPEPVLLKPRAPLGECIGWAFDGEPMRRYRPEFFGWRPPAEEPTRD